MFLILVFCCFLWLCTCIDTEETPLDLEILLSKKLFIIHLGKMDMEINTIHKTHPLLPNTTTTQTHQHIHTYTHFCGYHCTYSDALCIGEKVIYLFIELQRKLYSWLSCQGYHNPPSSGSKADIASPP